MRLLCLLNSASYLEPYFVGLRSILVPSLVLGVERVVFLVVGPVLGGIFEEGGRRLNSSESLHKVYVNLMNQMSKIDSNNKTIIWCVLSLPG